MGTHKINIPCIVESCENCLTSEWLRKKTCSFHHFRTEWAIHLTKLGVNLKTTQKKKLICSEHFRDKFKISRSGKEFLTPNALPTEKLKVEVLEEKTDPSKTQNNESSSSSSGSTTKPVKTYSRVTKPSAPSMYRTLLEMYTIKPCSVKLARNEIACIVPNCVSLDTQRFYCAMATLKSRYIILCSRHRDISKTYLQSFLVARVGPVTSLWNRQDNSVSGNSSDNDIPDLTQELQPMESDDEIELGPPPVKKMRTMIRSCSSSSDEQKSSSSTYSASSIISNEKNIKLSTKKFGIKHDQKLEEKIKPKKTEHDQSVKNGVITCCIKDCNSEGYRYNGKFLVTKIGEPPNIEYVIMCEKHRATTTEDGTGTKKPATSADLKTKIGENIRPCKNPIILKKVNYPQSKSLHSEIYILTEEFVTNVSSQGDVKHYIRREFSDSSITFTLAPSGFTREMFDAIRKSAKMVIPPNLKCTKNVGTSTDPIKPANDTNSQVVYIGGKPYRLTEMDPGTPKVSNAMSLELDDTGKLTIQQKKPPAIRIKPLSELVDPPACLPTVKSSTVQILPKAPLPVISNPFLPTISNTFKTSVTLPTLTASTSTSSSNASVWTVDRRPMNQRLPLQTVPAPKHEKMSSKIFKQTKPSPLTLNLKSTNILGPLLAKSTRFVLTRVPPQKAVPDGLNAQSSNPLNTPSETSCTTAIDLTDSAADAETDPLSNLIEMCASNVSIIPADIYNENGEQAGTSERTLAKNLQPTPNSVTLTPIERIQNESASTSSRSKQVEFEPTDPLRTESESIKGPKQSGTARKSTSKPAKPLSKAPAVAVEATQFTADSTEDFQVNIFTVSLASTEDTSKPKVLVMVKSPLYYCTNCDTSFANLNLIRQHELLCSNVYGKGFAKIKNWETLYVCEKCQCVGCNPLYIFTHLRRCMKAKPGIPKRRNYTCSICRERNSNTLGEIITHIDHQCPILYPDLIKVEPVEADNEDVLVIDSD